MSSNNSIPDSSLEKPRDIVVIGAGFSGLYLIYKMRSAGRDVTVLESGSDVGGTWYWNRYPGARCDVESVQYSYSFDENLQQDWEWTERFATQPEILRYINHVSDRFDLRRSVIFDTRVVSAHFHDAENVWEVSTETGEKLFTRYLITAVGCLSASRIPEIKGLNNYRGKVYHTGRWPHEGVDFSGMRVGVVGTGSSAIQAIPEIAKQATYMHVFQRTPNFSLPAHNTPLTPEKVQYWKSQYAALRKAAREEYPSGTIYSLPSKSAHEADDEERKQEFARRWAMGGNELAYAYNDLTRDQRANDMVAEFVRDRIREIVKDPELAETLCPYDYPIFTKRICIDTDYYATFNRDNVTLVDLRKGGIEEITETGIRTVDGSFDFDAIVFATGFDAITGPLTSMDIRGKGGQRLAEKWAQGPRTYLGLMTAGFPNLFTITGPGSPSVLSNMIVSIEQHVDFVSECLASLKDKGADRIEANRDAEDTWVAKVNEVASQTLFPKAASWYMGANIPGKARVFMPFMGVHTYRKICNEIAADNYRGFDIRNVNADQSTDRSGKAA
jgi:cyclohexanone monooxygenase